MSKQWRIKEQTTTICVVYILQKRLLGFLWWYNPDNFDGCLTGIYDTLSEAQASYKRKITPDKIEYLEVEE